MPLRSFQSDHEAEMAEIEHQFRIFNDEIRIREALLWLEEALTRPAAEEEVFTLNDLTLRMARLGNRLSPEEIGTMEREASLERDRILSTFSIGDFPAPPSPFPPPPALPRMRPWEAALARPAPPSPSWDAAVRAKKEEAEEATRATDAQWRSMHDMLNRW